MLSKDVKMWAISEQHIFSLDVNGVAYAQVPHTCKVNHETAKGSNPFAGIRAATKTDRDFLRALRRRSVDWSG
jgi:hypothetical protein